MYDLIIIGGGPAGATLARLLGKRYKILVLDKRNISEESGKTFEKCCGGLLAPDAQQMLAKFGLGVPKSVLLGPQLFAVRAIDIDNSIERYYQRHYINIDREKFDRWLISMIPSEVDVADNCVFTGYNQNEDHIDVKFFYEGKEYTESTRVLIGADGAHSKVRKLVYGNLIDEHMYISVQEWFENKNNEAFYGAIFDSEITDFYSWTIPKENELIVGTALKLDENVHEKFNKLKNKLINYGFDLSSPTKRCGAHIFRPQSIKDICLGNNNIALIGEAAGFISPSSAEGLSYAFKSALCLSEAIENELEGFIDNYKALTKTLRNNIVLKNLKSPAMYNTLLRKIIMKSGISSFKIYNI